MKEEHDPSIDHYAGKNGTYLIQDGKRVRVETFVTDPPVLDASEDASQAVEIFNATPEE
jgi:hypothetical protein